MIFNCIVYSPNLPRVDVVFVEVSIEPSDCKVVGCCHDPSSTDGVIRPNIRDDSHFGRETNVRKQKAPEKFGKGATYEPKTHGVEQQLVTAICVPADID